jgi:hypothetical protein
MVRLYDAARLNVGRTDHDRQRGKDEHEGALLVARRPAD